MKNSYTNPNSECDSVSSWSAFRELCFLSSFSINRFIHILWVQRDPWAMPFMNSFIRLKSQRCLPAYWGLVMLVMSKIDAKAEIDGRRNLDCAKYSLKSILLHGFHICHSDWCDGSMMSCSLLLTVKECDFCTIRKLENWQTREQLISRSLCRISTLCAIFAHI